MGLVEKSEMLHILSLIHILAAGVALAALIGLIIIMLMEARARKIREAKRQKIRGEKGELPGIIEEISSEEACLLYTSRCV